MPYTNPGGDVLRPGAQTYMAIAIHGMMPAKLPNQNGSQLGLPGSSYFSCKAPKSIIQAFMPKMADRAAMSLIPVIWEINTIIIEELKKYSIQRP